MADLGGNGFLNGAAGAGLNEVVLKHLNKSSDYTKLDHGTRQIISVLLIGAVTEALTGEGKVGAETALNAEKHNHTEILAQMDPEGAIDGRYIGVGNEGAQIVFMNAKEPDDKIDVLVEGFRESALKNGYSQEVADEMTLQYKNSVLKEGWEWTSNIVAFVPGVGLTAFVAKAGVVYCINYGKYKQMGTEYSAAEAFRDTSVNVISDITAGNIAGLVASKGVAYIGGTQVVKFGTEAEFFSSTIAGTVTANTLDIYVNSILNNKDYEINEALEKQGGRVRY